MERPGENASTHLSPCDGVASRDVAGRYRCDELEAELQVVDAGGALYGAFSGFLGQGRMELLDPVGADVWTLPCPRALDHTPPGDWTLVFVREPGGAITYPGERGPWAPLSRIQAGRRPPPEWYEPCGQGVESLDTPAGVH